MNHEQKLREKQQSRKDIYLYLVRYFKSNGCAPAYSEIAEGTDWSITTVQRTMSEFAKSDLIRIIHENVPRAYTLNGYAFKKIKESR